MDNQQNAVLVLPLPQVVYESARPLPDRREHDQGTDTLVGAPVCHQITTLTRWQVIGREELLPEALDTVLEILTEDPTEINPINETRPVGDILGNLLADTLFPRRGPADTRPIEGRMPIDLAVLVDQAPLATRRTQAAVRNEGTAVLLNEVVDIATALSSEGAAVLLNEVTDVAPALPSEGAVVLLNGGTGVATVLSKGTDVAEVPLNEGVGALPSEGARTGTQTLQTHRALTLDLIAQIACPLIITGEDAGEKVLHSPNLRNSVGRRAPHGLISTSNSNGRLSTTNGAVVKSATAS